MAPIEQLEIEDLRFEAITDRDLALELLEHHRGAPHVLLAQPQDVAVDMIADVEHLLASDPGDLLERDDVAALIHLVAREVLDPFAVMAIGDRRAARRIDLYERTQLVEERRLRA